MSNVRLGISLCVGAFAASSLWIEQPVSAYGQRRPPGEPVGVFVDSAPPPRNLRGLWQSAELAVLGRVTGAVERPSATGSTLTDFRISVIEVIKSDAMRPMPSELTVTVHGGTSYSTGRPVKTNNPVADAVTAASEGVFLLSFWTSENAYTIVNAGHFPVRNGQATLPESVKHMPELPSRASIPTAELISLLKSNRQPRH